MTYDERTSLLNLDDEELVKQCTVTTMRGSGPGGQHRNTTDSQVRLVLDADASVVAGSGESRSQHENRHRAVKRLRLAIALCLRVDDAPAYTGPEKVGKRAREYPHYVAALLDALHRHDWQVGDAARDLGWSTGRFARLLEEDDDVWGRVQQERQGRNMKPLRHS